MHKLLTPGPVPVPDFILAAINQEVIHHRSPAFASFYKELLDNLAYLFQAEIVGTMIGSGTYGVGAMIYSLFRPGEKVLVLNNGKFSGRWVDESRHLGLEVVEIKADWGKSIDTQRVLNELSQHRETKGLIITHSETSTGTLIDLEEMAFQVKRAHPDVLIAVDGITSIGAMPYYHDDWGIDASVTASQKALMNPAGTVAFALSSSAANRLRPTHKGDYRNFYNYIQAIEAFTYPFTAPVQLLYGLDAALKQVREKGLPQVWNECHQSARTFRKEMTRIGAEHFSDYPSDSLTAFRMPGRNVEELKKRMEKEFGWIISSGQGAFKGEILRISHMGTATTISMKALLQDLDKWVKG